MPSLALKGLSTMSMTPRSMKTTTAIAKTKAMTMKDQNPTTKERRIIMNTAKPKPSPY